MAKTKADTPKIEKKERKMNGKVRLHFKRTKKELDSGLKPYAEVAPAVAEKFNKGEEFDLSKLNPQKEEDTDKGGEDK